MEDGLKDLVEELVGAMVTSATDELGDGYPDWEWRYDDMVRITTEQSRDPNRSRNGGEYYGYCNVELRPDGVEIWNGSSCELVSVAEEKSRSARLYPVSLTKEGLGRMVHLAEARALIQVAPEETLDPKMIAVITGACALFDSPKAGIGQLKAAVRAYEEDK